jgi:hypothetical protein
MLRMEVPTTIDRKGPLPKNVAAIHDSAGDDQAVSTYLQLREFSVREPFPL